MYLKEKIAKLVFRLNWSDISLLISNLSISVIAPKDILLVELAAKREVILPRVVPKKY